MEISLGRVAEMLGGSVVGDPERIIKGAAPFELAEAHHITLAAQPKFLKNLSATNAGAALAPDKGDLPGYESIGRKIDADGADRADGADGADRTDGAVPGAAGRRPEGAEGRQWPDLVRVSNPAAAFARLLAHFHPRRRPSWADPASPVSPAAHVGKGFVAGENTFVAPFALIGNDVRLGRNVFIHAHVTLGDGVAVGDDATIFDNVTIGDRCRIGNRVTIQPGSVIGADGYGYAPDGRSYVKIPHTGIVVIEDDVEIGANNAIDRATFGETRICRGVKTDNLVHVAHNVTVGEDTLLVAQVGVAGSVAIGRHAILAGQVGVSGHLSIGDDVIIGPQSGVAKDIPAGKVVSGSPEMDHRVWLRVARLIPMLPEIKKRLDALENRFKDQKPEAKIGHKA